jgi:hypothetical protein
VFCLLTVTRGTVRAGPQQQPPHFLVLPLQYLGQQVLGNRTFAAGKLGREPLRVRVPGQRQGEALGLELLEVRRAAC